MRIASCFPSSSFHRPDEEVVEQRLLSADTDLEIGFRLVSQSGGFEEANRLAVEGYAHLVTHDFDAVF